MTSGSQSPSLINDKPITSTADDRLGYAHFARALAQSLTEMAPLEGLVISLEGAWGSGKTSALNLTINHIRRTEISYLAKKPLDDLPEAGSELSALWDRYGKDRRLHVVRFNPWFISGQDNLVRAFFVEVSAAISHDQSGRLEKAFRAMGDRLPAIGSAAGSLAGFAAGSVAFGVLAGLPAAGAAATGARALGELAKGSLSGEQSLDKLKTELTSALEEHGKRIIVVIDDLDRLTPSEIRQMFSLVKSLGDLPNIVYILSFDRREVREALERGQEAIDEKFLEKIIQVQMKLPPLLERDLLQLLLTRLDAILVTHKINDSERWRALFHRAVVPYIATPRDVARLTNAIQVIWPNVAGEVDPSDLILLTLLQVFENSIYEKIVELTPVLVGSKVSFQKDRELINYFPFAEANKAEPARYAVAHLFPKLAEEMKVPIWDNVSYLVRRKHRRLSTDEYYRNYFAFMPHPDRVPVAHLRELLRNEDLSLLLEKLLCELATQESTREVSRVADLLDQILEEITTDTLPFSPIMRALLERSEQVIDKADQTNILFTTDNNDRLINIFMVSLEVRTVEERTRLIKEAINHESGITLTCQVIMRLARQHGLFGSEPVYESGRLLTRETVDEAISVCLARLRKLAATGQLLFTTRPKRLLLIWSQWATPEEVRSWISDQLTENEKVLRLADVLPRKNYITNAGGEGDVFAFDRKPFEEIIDIDLVLQRLAELAALDRPEGDACMVQSKLLAAMNHSSTLDE
jgi:predicted KAP-like P-loop ATPase